MWYSNLNLCRLHRQLKLRHETARVIVPAASLVYWTRFFPGLFTWTDIPARALASVNSKQAQNQPTRCFEALDLSQNELDRSTYRRFKRF
jgi:hypothetical protein